MAENVWIAEGDIVDFHGFAVSALCQCSSTENRLTSGAKNGISAA